ncbi:hypothetical protein TGPRC2_359550, partial [Toxoplasma gondii TgCatPRC2]
AAGDRPSHAGALSSSSRARGSWGRRGLAPAEVLDVSGVRARGAFTELSLSRRAVGTQQVVVSAVLRISRSVSSEEHLNHALAEDLSVETLSDRSRVVRASEAHKPASPSPGGVAPLAGVWLATREARADDLLDFSDATQCFLKSNVGKVGGEIEELESPRPKRGVLRGHPTEGDFVFADLAFFVAVGLTEIGDLGERRRDALSRDHRPRRAGRRTSASLRASQKPTVSALARVWERRRGLLLGVWRGLRVPGSGLGVTVASVEPCVFLRALQLFFASRQRLRVKRKLAFVPRLFVAEIEFLLVFRVGKVRVTTFVEHLSLILARR